MMVLLHLKKTLLILYEIDYKYGNEKANMEENQFIMEDYDGVIVPKENAHFM